MIHLVPSVLKDLASEGQEDGQGQQLAVPVQGVEVP